MPDVPGQQAPTPQPAAGAAQGQPPFGSSPATQPTQNSGYKVAGLKLVGLALMALENSIPMLGAGTPEGSDVLSSIQKMSKHVPPGTITPADVINVAKNIMMKAQQGQQQMQAMQAQKMQQGQMPQAAPQQAPQAMPRAA